MLCYKGHRIRASDRYLTYRFICICLGLLFIGGILLFHIQQLQSLDFSALQRLDVQTTFSLWDLISILMSP